MNATEERTYILEWHCPDSNEWEEVDSGENLKDLKALIPDYALAFHCHISKFRIKKWKKHPKEI